MPQAGFNPPAQSHASYEASALPRLDLFRWLLFGKFLCTFADLKANANGTMHIYAEVCIRICMCKLTLEGSMALYFVTEARAEILNYKPPGVLKRISQM